MLRQGIYLAIFLFAIQSFAAKKNHFVYCNENGLKTLNPAMTIDGTTIRAVAHLYSQLVDHSIDGEKIEPHLAKSWEISEDGLTYTFKLRKDVKFHSTKYFTPTRGMTADDVVFSFERQRDKKHPFHKVNGGVYNLFHSLQISKVLKKAEKVDRYTVRFHLKRPFTPFLSAITISAFGIHSKEYADQLLKRKTPENIDHMPIGTGPWQLNKHKQDAYLKYDRNPKYWNGPANLKKLTYVPVQEASVRLQKLKSKECDLIYEPAPFEIPKLKSDKKFRVFEKLGPNVGYVAMNVKKKPFDNVLVRRAINHAVNRDMYLETLYSGRALKSHGPLSPTNWAHSKNVKKYEYNVSKAKELLKKAGYPNGFKTTLWTLPVSRAYIPDGKKMGELIQSDLAKIGIKVKLESREWASYLAGAKRGDHEMAMLGWNSDRGEPDILLGPNLGCGESGGGFNVAQWCHPKVSDLLLKGVAIHDRTKRKKIYEEVQKIFAEEVPWVPLAHSKFSRIGQTDFEGFLLSPLEVLYFYKVSYQKN